MGDMTHEAGFQIIAFSNKSLHWLLWFVPKIEPIYIATKSSVEYLKSYDAKMHRGEVGKIDNIPCEKVSFADGEIWIHAVSLCEEKGFFKPVLLDKDGHTIDQSIAMHSQINEVVAREYTYNITNSFVDNAKRGYEMNADVQQTKKLNDSGVVNTTR